MFSFFGKKGPVSEKEQAKAAFEKIAGLKSESRAARSARIRMALLCRAALDKIFVEGAERTAAYQTHLARAIIDGREKPLAPVVDHFTKLKVGEDDVLVYLPEEYAEQAFIAGERYQRAEIDALSAIDFVQAQVDQICRLELQVDEGFPALQFLREEIAAGATQDCTVTDPAPRA